MQSLRSRRLVEMKSVITRIALVFGCHFQSIRAAHNVAHAIGSTYESIPENLLLTNVVVIHRHGDRSQISREIGPNFPETSDIKDIWDSKLPITKTMLQMAAAAHIPAELLSSHVKDAVFTGWDQKNIPYGQLTELGANQLINIGKELRRRYVGTLINEEHDVSSLIYCRSTHFCRTMQSLRSLLSGFLDVDGGSYPQKFPLLPIILVRAKNQETMFPGADGPCLSMIEKRAALLADGIMENSIPEFLKLEQKMKAVLGYSDKVTWLPIKEILTCYEAHGIPFPEGISESDADRVTDLAGWMWGTLYNDDSLNRLAIGRFLRELIDVFHPAVHNLPIPTPSSSAQFINPTSVNPNSTDGITSEANYNHAKMMIFSGHDSTLVPVLCALGIYDMVWPPYASYLSIEIAESINNPNEKFVRAIYNDNEKTIIGSSSIWCPYDIFHSRLESLALTHEEYSTGCSSCSSSSDPNFVDDDIKATMGEK